MAIVRTEVQKRQVPFGNGNRGFLNLAGPHRADSAPGGSKGKDPDPVKQTSQLNVRHFCHVLLLPGRPLKSLPQCQAFRQLQYRFSHLHPLFPVTISVWERRSISRAMSIPALCSSGTLSSKQRFGEGRSCGQTGMKIPHYSKQAAVARRHFHSICRLVCSIVFTRQCRNAKGSSTLRDTSAFLSFMNGFSEVRR